MNKKQVSGKSVQYNKLEPALCLELRTIVKALSLPGKGLLAADESPSSLEERFKNFNLENSETTRRDYRQMLFSTDKVSLKLKIDLLFMKKKIYALYMYLG